jgi:hypothetical protein
MTGKPERPENPEQQELSLRKDIGATMHPAPIGNTDHSIPYKQLMILTYNLPRT